MTYTIKNTDVALYNESEPFVLPKYTSQLINLANQNGQATRPSIVGQMSELFSEFLNSDTEKSTDGWRCWYKERYPYSVKQATDRIETQIGNLREALSLINRDMIESWVENLIYQKTFNGLYVQKAILSVLAEKKGLTYRMATPEEESQGIDGYIGNTAYSVKPDTYKSMERLPESIGVKMIYYKKEKSCLTVEIDE